MGITLSSSSPSVPCSPTYSSSFPSPSNAWGKYCLSSLSFLPYTPFSPFIFGHNIDGSFIGHYLKKNPTWDNLYLVRNNYHFFGQFSKISPLMVTFHSLQLWSPSFFSFSHGGMCGITMHSPFIFYFFSSKLFSWFACKVNMLWLFYEFCWRRLRIELDETNSKWYMEHVIEKFLTIPSQLHNWKFEPMPIRPSIFPRKISL